MFTVHGCPQFLAALPDHPSPYNRPGFGSAPADWADLTRFVVAVCNRYKGKLWAVQWWNEPDLGWYDYSADGGNDLWIGSVTGNTAAQKAQRQQDFAKGQKVTYQAVQSVDPTILTWFGGFIYWDNTSGVNAQVQALANTAITDGGTCLDYVDGLGFHFYGEATAVTDVLARFRALEATRNALNPSWRIAMDEIGSTGVVDQAGHVLKIWQWLMLGAAFGCDMVGLYAHEDADTLGDPMDNSTVATAIDDAYAALAGKSVVEGATLADGSVWLAFADETDLQYPTSTPSPSSGYETQALPFTSTSPWNEAIGGSATFSTDSRTTTIRSTAYGIFGVNNVNWTINTYYAKSTDTAQNILVHGIFSGSPADYTVSIKIPAGAVPNGNGNPSVTDHHWAIFDPDGTTIHEMWYVYWNGTQWQAASYCRSKIAGTGWNLFNNDVLVSANTSAGTGAGRAVSVSLLGGLIRSGEVLNDGIDHALAIAVPRPWLKRSPRVYPADTVSYLDGDSTSVGPIPYSTRFGIPSTVDLSSLGLNTYYKRLAQALQTYGCYVVDVSGNPCFYSEYPAAESDGAALRTDSSQMNAIIQQLKACDWYTG